MSYVRAEEILPKELIKTIQQYINGESIYIPSKEKQEFLNSGKFRVNANGNSVDVWLIYRCRKCKHSWNLTIFERVKPKKIPLDLYESFLDNDTDTACRYGNDIDFLKKNNAELK